MGTNVVRLVLLGMALVAGLAGCRATGPDLGADASAQRGQSSAATGAPSQSPFQPYPR